MDVSDQMGVSLGLKVEVTTFNKGRENDVEHL